MRILISTAVLVATFFVAISSNAVKRTGRRLRLVFDPKTVVQKVPLPSSNNENELRFLAFGASITWGATISNRSDAFPYILSKDATNIALRANGPNFPAVCTQTMVGNSLAYDVILLEYYMRAEEGLVPLARRIRQRFPEATIVFVQLWYPSMYYLNTGPSPVFLNNWGAANNVGLWDPKIYELLMETSPDEWSIIQTLEQTKCVTEAINAVGGIIYEMPRNKKDARQSIIQNAHFFNSEDWHHLSTEGHALVARGIQELLQKAGAVRSDKLGTWGSGDSCASWFATGECSLQYSGNLRIFAKKGPKWGLEMASTGGSIQVINPFDGPRQLHVSYMASGPAPSIYPRTRVTFDKPNFEPVIIDPTTYVNDGHFVHIVQTTQVAVIPPGKISIHFEDLDKQDRIKLNDEWKPFRLTGIAVTSLGNTFGAVKATTASDFSKSLSHTGVGQ